MTTAQLEGQQHAAHTHRSCHLPPCLDYQEPRRSPADVEGEEDERHSGPEKRLLGSVQGLSPIIHSCLHYAAMLARSRCASDVISARIYAHALMMGAGLKLAIIHVQYKTTKIANLKLLNIFNAAL